MSIRTHLTLAAAAVVALAATVAPALADDPIHTGPAVYTGPAVKTISAPLVDGTGASAGTVTLNQDAQGVVQVLVNAAGLPAGGHGVHIHAAGKCEGPAFTTAAGHFNPAGAKHGLDSADGPHAGDLPGIPASFTGTGTHTVTTNRISLTVGATSIDTAAGAALVVHAAADDQVTDPTGNSGARIACAVLVAAQAAPAATASATPKPPATGSGFETDGSTSRDALFVAIAGALMAATAGYVVTRRR
ncbi:MAG: superoxide dismutase family protein [Chloroflexi bacterium]|nr:superoxide dismutase family protein [Chloroflexota bacterium]